MTNELVNTKQCALHSLRCSQSLFCGNQCQDPMHLPNHNFHQSFNTNLFRCSRTTMGHHPCNWTKECLRHKWRNKITYRSKMILTQVSWILHNNPQLPQPCNSINPQLQEVTLRNPIIKECCWNRLNKRRKNKKKKSGREFLRNKLKSKDLKKNAVRWRRSTDAKMIKRRNK